MNCIAGDRGHFQMVGVTAGCAVQGAGFGLVGAWSRAPFAAEVATSEA